MLYARRERIEKTKPGGGVRRGDMKDWASDTIVDWLDDMMLGKTNKTMDEYLAERGFNTKFIVDDRLLDFDETISDAMLYEHVGEW